MHKILPLFFLLFACSKSKPQTETPPDGFVKKPREYFIKKWNVE